MRVLAFLTFCFLCGVTTAEAASVQRGLNFALANCARCHSIDKVTPSPLNIAPPFRTLQERYPVESLEKPLAEGIVTGHQNMPEFPLEPVADFIAFLKIVTTMPRGRRSERDD